MLSRNPGLPGSPPSRPAVDRVGDRLDGDVSDRHLGPDNGSADEAARGKYGDRDSPRVDRHRHHHTGTVDPQTSSSASRSDDSIDVAHESAILEAEISRLKHEIRSLSTSKSRKTRSTRSKPSPRSAITRERIDFDDDLCENDGGSGQIAYGGPTQTALGGRTQTAMGWLSQTASGGTGCAAATDDRLSCAAAGTAPTDVTAAGDSAGIASQPEGTGCGLTRTASTCEDDFRIASGGRTRTPTATNGPTQTATLGVQQENIPVREKAHRKQLKLEKFDGVTVPLETFLCKYTNCAKHNEWSQDERVAFLRDSLAGDASQVLWVLADDVTEADIIQVLRSRFGNSNQAERYRAELNSRRCQRGETTQQVFADIRRLLSLSFPGQSGELFEIIGRDAFLTALDDPSLRVRVLDTQPKTLDDTLATVVRMQAYTDASTAAPTVADDSAERRRVRFVSPVRETESDRRIKRLEECIEKQRKEIQDLRNAVPQPRPVWGGVSAGQAQATQGPNQCGGFYGGAQQLPRNMNTAGVDIHTVQQQAPAYVGDMSQYQELPRAFQGHPQPSMRSYPAAPSRVERGRGRGRSNRLPRDVCARCHERGHWKARCPAQGYGPDEYGVRPGGMDQNNGFLGGQATQGNNQGVCIMSGCGRSDTYVDVVMKGRTLSVLLDTGCELSVCPSRMCRNAKITPTDTVLYAANNTPIPVVGSTRLSFKVQGMSMCADVLVSDEVDEFILGYNFLAENDCEWLFTQRRVIINGLSIPLRRRPTKCNVRRIFVRESVVVPVDTSVNVPVRMPFINRYTPSSNWVTESRQVRPGLLAGRVLLSHDDECAAIPFLNMSGVEQSIRPGHSLGEAIAIDSDMVFNYQPAVAPTDPASVDLVTSTDNDRPTVSVVDNEETLVKCAAINTVPAMPPTAEAEGGNNCDDNSDNDFAHIQPVIDRLPFSLTDEQREQAIALIKRNADVFSRHEFDVGCTNLLTARIDTGNSPPIAQPLRRHPRLHLDTIDRTIEQMEQAGIVEPASSPWSANLVVVARKDDDGNPRTPRITIDFRGLNNVTRRDQFPIPHLHECLRSLDNATYMSLVDISNSFYTVPIHLDDRDKTAFVTRRGQFRLTRLGQGCTNSPAIFCRLMAMVLRGLSCCLAYIDDVIVKSASFSAHINDLEAVFDRFRKANLKLKPTKCKLFQQRCKFVGHVVGPEGIAVDDDKIGCIVNWPFPRTVTELRGFLGLCSYYRSFCPGFANVADPLTECLRKGVPLRHTQERQAAFDKLKHMLSSTPVLAMPMDDPQCLYVLDTDASLTGASAILQQWQSGKLRVIEFASRTFSAAERRYCATRRELTALIFGLKQFRTYLLGRKFEIRVDNQALTYYRRMKEPTGQAARYLDYLSMFDFDVVYRPGARHVNADAVSRLRPCELDGGEPCRQCNRRVTGRHRVGVVQTRRQRRRAARGDVTSGGTVTGETSHMPARSPAVNHPDAVLGHDVIDGQRRRCCKRRAETDAPSSACRSDDAKAARRRRRTVRKYAALPQLVMPPTIDTEWNSWTPTAIRDMQLRNDDTAIAITWLERNGRPNWTEVQMCSPILRALWQQFDSLLLIDGVLYRSFYNESAIVTHYQLVLPSEMKVSFLNLIHSDAAGHMKYAKCTQHVIRRAWWLNWKRDLKLFIKCCPKCEGFHRGQPPKQARLQHVNIAGAPGEAWGIDLIGPFPPSYGYTYMFTAICLFSKYGICVPIRNKEASTVARVIVDHIFLTHGPCFHILSDLGPEFQAELVAEIFKIFDVKRLKTSGYRPQTNGACEVWHRTLNSMFAKVVREDQKDWANWVRYVTYCYNATEHSATGFPPFFIFTGRMPLWSIDLALPQVRNNACSVPEFATETTQRLERVSSLVRQHLRKAAEGASRWYDRRSNPKCFDPGDLVRVYYPRRYRNRTSKWQLYFSTEGRVVKKFNDATYLVASKTWRSPKVIHVDKIKHIQSFNV